MNLFSLGGFFSDIWMSIWLSLNDFVYSIISVLYQVFEGVANVNLFSEEVFKDITSRIYIIMGIAMLFIFAYNLVLMIINPEEKKSTGQTTKVVKETIISLILVILLPTIFNYMSIFQKHILESQIISQIILGDSGGTSAEECDYSEYTIYNEYDIGNVEDTSFLNWKSILSLGIYQIYLSTKDSTPTAMLTEYCEFYSDELSPSQRGAYALPVTIFQAFYHPTRVDYNSCEEWIETCKSDKSCSTNDVSEDEDKEMCAYYVYDVKLAKYMGNIAPFNSESKFYSKVKADDGTFEFNGLMALAAGVLGLYMFVCYTIAIGTRVAKLGFLQIISPIAVMMRIIPKQKEAMFDKWLKHLINTYLDVFIRLMIIYFSLFAISLVPDVIDTLFSSIEGSWYVAALSTVVVILGILMFAQKAPDLFKEFFGNSGNFALKSPQEQLRENKYAKGIFSGAGALGAVTAKSAMNTYKAIRGAGSAKDKWKEAGKTVLRTPRLLGRQIGAARTGFKYGQEANNWDDMRKYTYGAAAEQMTKAGLFERIGDAVSNEFETHQNFYKARYEEFNSPAELAKAQKLDKVVEALKKLEDKLDGSGQVKAANYAVDSIRDHIKKGENFSFTHDGTTYTEKDTQTAEGMERVLQSLEKYQKERVGIARQAAYKEAVSKNDVELLSLAQDYKKEVSDNLLAVNESLKKVGGKQITNVDVLFSDVSLSGDATFSWKDIRDAGASAGKSSQEIKSKATKQQEINGKK